MACHSEPVFTLDESRAIDDRIADMIRLVIGDGGYLRKWQDFADLTRKVGTSTEPAGVAPWQVDAGLERARIRLECLKVAAFDADRADGSSEAVLARAQMFAGFVFGSATIDQSSPSLPEQIDHLRSEIQSERKDAGRRS